MKADNDGFFTVILGAIIATMIVLAVMQVPRVLDQEYKQHHTKPEYVKQAEAQAKLNEVKQGQ